MMWWLKVPLASMAGFGLSSGLGLLMVLALEFPYEFVLGIPDRLLLDGADVFAAPGWCGPRLKHYLFGSLLN
ncbi:hypothetical protein Nepgr_026656 [Nepenthes gracilis]|uniref:Uncharacterized protein n=1 Tax=Nepenthes gracilis TaxID=150966 RepID=A0AAD3T7L0_NEPGR|nr:hypothetical protein Nepgr_026656 [Nepenthes gracilis]